MINNALYDTTLIAECLNHTVGIVPKGIWFVSQVYHKAPWDIKRETPWNKTIGNGTYPGGGVQVVYREPFGDVPVFAHF